MFVHFINGLNKYAWLISFTIWTYIYLFFLSHTFPSDKLEWLTDIDMCSTSSTTKRAYLPRMPLVVMFCWFLKGNYVIIIFVTMILSVLVHYHLGGGERNTDESFYCWCMCDKHVGCELQFEKKCKCRNVAPGFYRCIWHYMCYRKLVFLVFIN